MVCVSPCGWLKWVIVVLASQPTLNLRDLGLSDIRASQLDELVSRLLPHPGPEDSPTLPYKWRTSHISSDSFFYNKHGEFVRQLHEKKKSF